MNKTVLGIIGSYRKGRIIDSAVTEILKGAESEGAKISILYLRDLPIEFCTNCRTCTQEKSLLERGKCILDDSMEEILRKIDMADAFVIGSPINYGNVSAITRRFLERLIVYAYWPWDMSIPRYRIKRLHKKAVIVISSAAPAFFIRFFSRGAIKTLKDLCRGIGASVEESIIYGAVAGKENKELSRKDLEKALLAGQNLVQKL